MVVFGIEPIASELYIYYSQSSLLLMQVVVPASLLFLTQYNLYLYIVLPITVIMQIWLVSYTDEVYKSQVKVEDY